jgi:hypothetical protein
MACVTYWAENIRHERHLDPAELILLASKFSLGENKAK